MTSKLNNFGRILKELRIKKELSLREVCKLTNYDPSNWSKIERGVLAPPSDEKILKRWAKVLGLSQDKRKSQDFIDGAQIAQGIIPHDIFTHKDMVKSLPAFFRTLRNEKS